jgi:NlpC/P60 family protein/dipeptidyl peptidase-like protein
MSDPRVTLPANLASVKGQPMQIAAPIVDLVRSPDGPRQRQAIFGELVTEITTQDDWSLIQSDKDNYVGYVPTDTLVSPNAPTHWVSALATHVYQSGDLKSPDLNTLTFGSLVTVTDIDAQFARCTVGYIPKTHLTKIGTFVDDPVAIAELFVGTPYLWGGNSRLGIDCSGLVQAALVACGMACPGDSDLQEAALGELLPPGTSYERGDLLFWKGHVALVVNPTTIIHATGYPMAVINEPLEAAIERIMEQEGHGVSSHKRL